MLLIKCKSNKLEKFNKKKFVKTKTNIIIIIFFNNFDFDSYKHCQHKVYYYCFCMNKVQCF